MCGIMSYSGPRPRFVHSTRRVEEMPQFPTQLPKEKLQCAFPDIFDLLVVTMFLHENGYTGKLDNECERSPGSWYALSWGCIHYDSLYRWRAFSRNALWTFAKRCWRWIVTFGKEPIAHGDGRTIALVLCNPFPISLFKRALSRLTRKGYLQLKEEENAAGDRYAMYYPTRKLAETIL